MKYMTPALIQRFRSEDEHVAEVASVEWEAACEKYNRWVRSVFQGLPNSLQRLLSSGYCLHDAKVLTIVPDDWRSEFTLFLQLDSPDKKRVAIKYKLYNPDELSLQKSVDFSLHRCLKGDGPPLQWCMYDEVGIEQDGPERVYSHSLLFTGGWEIRLLFLKVQIRRLKKILVPGSTTSDDDSFADELHFAEDGCST
jgi:hypothetical protein